MTVKNNRRFLGGSGERRLLRAAMAVSTATIFSAVCAGTANAAPPAIPTFAAVSSSDADGNSDVDVAAIKALKLNYFADIDMNNWAALYALFTPNAVVDTSPDGPIFTGRDMFVAFDAITLTIPNTHHEGYDPQITVTSPTTADGVWQMNDRLFIANIIGLHGHGYYTDSYVKVGDSWLVDYSKLTRTHWELDILPGVLNIVIPLYDAPTQASPPTQTADAPPTINASAKVLATSAPTSPNDAPGAPALPKTGKAHGAPRAVPTPVEMQAKSVATVDSDTKATDSIRALSGASNAADHAPIAAKPTGVDHGTSTAGPKKAAKATKSAKPAAA
ncbi:hypothetical protein BH09ACT8_BH09ACT8_58010 [soil metagenome]